MVDFTLSEGDDIKITTSSIIDNFYFEGGKIDVLPGVNYTMNGSFYFCPTSSENPLESIYKSLVARIEIETGANGRFSGFVVYDLYPRNTPLFFPCIVFGNVEKDEPIMEYMFGGDTMQQETMVCDLAFKYGESRIIGGIIVEREDLAFHYLEEMREIIKDINYLSDFVNIGAVGENSSIEKPQEQNQSLYGFSMEIDVSFKTPTN
jgi:hypothetical protein